MIDPKSVDLLVLCEGSTTSRSSTSLKNTFSETGRKQEGIKSEKKRFEDTLRLWGVCRELGVSKSHEANEDEDLGVALNEGPKRLRYRKRLAAVSFQKLLEIRLVQIGTSLGKDPYPDKLQPFLTHQSHGTQKSRYQTGQVHARAPE